MERGDFLARRARSTKLPPVASADQELVGPVVAVEKVVGHLAEAHPIADCPEVAHLAGATELRVEVQQAGAEARAQSFLKS